MACQYYNICESRDEDAHVCKSYVDSIEYCGIAKRWDRE